MFYLLLVCTAENGFSLSGILSSGKKKGKAEKAWSQRFVNAFTINPSAIRIQQTVLRGHVTDRAKH